MKNTISHKLINLGFEDCKPIVPIANYVQTKIFGCAIYASGQLPFKCGNIEYKGKIGLDLDVEEGKKAAELCMVNALHQIALTVEDSIEKIKSCIKIEVFVNCEPSFERHAEIANGASNLLIKVLGEKGKHARIAVGVSSLPLNSAVEITAIFEIEKQEMEQ